MDLLKGLLAKTQGYKTYAAAAFFAYMAWRAFRAGDVQRAGELLAAALAAVGLRSALPTPTPAAPVAPTTSQPAVGAVTPNVLGTNVSNGKTLP